MTASPPNDHLITPDAPTLALMGFDIARLRALRTRARSRENKLEQMGFDVDRLRFLRLVAHREQVAKHNA